MQHEPLRGTVLYTAGLALRSVLQVMHHAKRPLYSQLLHTLHSSRIMVVSALEIAYHVGVRLVSVLSEYVSAPCCHVVGGGTNPADL